MARFDIQFKYFQHALIHVETKFPTLSLSLSLILQLTSLFTSQFRLSQSHSKD